MRSDREQRIQQWHATKHQNEIQASLEDSQALRNGLILLSAITGLVVAGFAASVAVAATTHSDSRKSFAGGFAVALGIITSLLMFPCIGTCLDWRNEKKRYQYLREQTYAPLTTGLLWEYQRASDQDSVCAVAASDVATMADVNMQPAPFASNV